MRWDAEDTLVFRIGISNKTGVALQYVPESLMVRAGTRIYYQSLAEATGLVAPYATAPVYFAVTGSPDGSRNALSPKNDFMILLQRVEPVTTLAAAAPAEPFSPYGLLLAARTNSTAAERDRRNSEGWKALIAPRSPAPAPPAVAPVTPGRVPAQLLTPWQQPVSPAAAPVHATPSPPVYQMPAPARANAFAYQTPAPLRRVPTWSASERNLLPASSRYRGPTGRSARSFEDEQHRRIGFSIHLGFGSR